MATAIPVTLDPRAEDLRPEARAAIEAADAELLNGRARLVVQAEIEPAVPAGDLDVFPLGDLSLLPPDFRAAIEQGEADVLAGRTLTHAEVQQGIEEMRLRRA